MGDETAEYRAYTRYEYVSRKRKGKNNRKSKQNLTLKLTEDDVKSEPENPISLESIGDSNLYENDENTDAALNCSESLIRRGDRVVVDASLSAPAKYKEPPVKLSTEDILPVPTVIESQVSVENNLNTKALSKYASTYELEKFEKNALIIFNQKNIEGLKPRLGTDKDVEALMKTFQTYGFEIVEYTDLTKDEIFDKLKEFSEKDFTDYGCIGVVVLTHGLEHGMLRAKDKEYYSENNIISHFKVHDKPKLITKPKFLIIQACRYTKSIAQDAAVFSRKLSLDVDEDLEPYVLPVEADMLVLHSSYSGNSTHKEENSGSWFIQSLCKKIDQLADAQDLESIIREVKRDIAIDKYDEQLINKGFESDPNQQIPVMTSTLIRNLYLKKYGDNSPPGKKSPNETMSSKNGLFDITTSSTPLLIQFGPCSCFLEHFNYLKNCLGYYIEENPDDIVAHTYLELANTYEDVTEFNNSKKKMAKVICTHLRNKSENFKYLDYLYLYEH